MPDESSFVITHLLDGLAEAMPEAEQAKLAPYRARAARAGSERSAEWNRAFRTARWARDLVAEPAHSALGRELRRAAEVVKQVEEIVGAEITNVLDLAMLGPSVAIGVESEIAWVHEAVGVATRAAEQVGWDGIGWPGLVDELLTIGS